MKAAIGKSSKRFAENLEQLKKESARQIKQSFASIVTIKDFLSETESIESSERYTKLVSKLDSVERRLSRFENSLNDRVGKLIHEYDKLKTEVDGLAQERNIYKGLYDLSMDISSQRDLNTALPSVVQATADILSCDNVILQIIDDDGSIRLQYESSKKNASCENNEPSRQVSDAVLATGDPVYIHTSENSSKSEVCLPLKSGDTAVGLLHAVRYDQKFRQFDLDLLKSISEKIAVTVESNRLFTDLEESRESLIEDLRQKYRFDEIVGNSPEMARVLATVADVAETESTVLIEGESGTGKELLARAIHFNSRREDKPFVAINCAAIPETLLESELFGYEKGAFTGAVARKPGKFELADNGTVFLDEIGELSPILQVKLLRFLQSGEFEPLGGTSLKHADVRIISATKRDLGKMVEAGEFRDDLFYRINVIAIRLPRLAKRTGDIENLANHFLGIYAEKNGKDIESISENAMSRLKGYNFPGNIRELENIIERAVVLCKGNVLSSNNLPEQVKHFGIPGSAEPSNIKELNDLKKRLWREVVEPVEKSFVLRLLDVSGGNISAAARSGGLHRKQLQRILKRNSLTSSEIPLQKES
jgi:transcriptional regulator with GAF, ATPase, and Fis domain